MLIELNARDNTLCRKCDIWYSSEKYGECPLCMAYGGIDRVLEKQFDIAEAFERFKLEIAAACRHAEEGGYGGRRYETLREGIEVALRRLKGATITRI